MLVDEMLTTFSEEEKKVLSTTNPL